MDKIKTVASATLCAALLVGCEGTQMPDMSAVHKDLTDYSDRVAVSFGPGGELAKAKKTEPGGTAFSNALYEGYRDLAESEYAQGDYRDSDAYATRAVRAAADKDDGPPELSSRQIPESAAGELGQARERLMKALADGASSKAPADAAKAQVMFDCWMEQQEENFQPEHIARCRSGFMTAMASVDQTIAAAETEEMKSYVVYFPLDSAELTPASMRLVEQAIDDAKQMGGARVYLTGHADKAGAEPYNQSLSSRRALAVVDALKQGGLAETALEWKAAGETAPAVPTEDGIANRENRRVELVITK